MAKPRIGWTIAAAAAALMAVTAEAAEPSLDYGAYKSEVEPIFLAKRPQHARCYACHAGASNAFRLERLAPGALAWTDEQSRRNFATVVTLVTPGDPAASRLLLHPLAPEAGGDLFHSGGRQFVTREDPLWQAIARWVRGGK
jgi:hypothetical protein